MLEIFLSYVFFLTKNEILYAKEKILIEVHKLEK